MEIPKITNARLAELRAAIKPVVRKGKELWYIADVDPKNVAFTWDPVYTEKTEGLKLLRTARTLHTYGYYGMFKPSVAEVLAQIPQDLVSKVAAFEVCGPGTASDLNEEKEALNAGFHVSETKFYGLEAGVVRKPPKTDKPTIWDRLTDDEDSV